MKKVSKMYYLNENVVQQVIPTWKISLEIIEEAIALMRKNDFSQPIKPYLRYQNQNNRIIAMPAYVGGEIHVSGIKWIASFPENIEKGLPRAHSIIILNNADTGQPIACINSGLVSGIRTAAVSGVMIKNFISSFPRSSYILGVNGLGPIGELHINMAQELLGHRLKEVRVHDLKIKKIPASLSNYSNIKYVNDWKDSYHASDIFITCTTSTSRYINEIPPAGSLQLNVSLRDYDAKILQASPHIIVDDWDEVCRENTDIENAQKNHGLQKQHTRSISEVIVDNYFAGINHENFKKNEFAIFNPMGMGIFDIAMAKFLLDSARSQHLGVDLN